MSQKMKRSLQTLLIFQNTYLFNEYPISVISKGFVLPLLCILLDYKKNLYHIKLLVIPLLGCHDRS